MGEDSPLEWVGAEVLECADAKVPVGFEFGLDSRGGLVLEWGLECPPEWHARLEGQDAACVGSGNARQVELSGEGQADRSFWRWFGAHAFSQLDAGGLS